MADKDKKIDPYDVEALEKSLNDSATRVSALWIAYLLFGLYLVIAAASAKHRELFLSEGISLPALNISLPVIGFFFLAPVLFIVFHSYLLLQILLLARTAGVYDEAIEMKVSNTAHQEKIRQRLSNSLFIQLFSGSTREKTGNVGRALRLMALLTLAIAPSFVLLFVQFKFLPYHSSFATWAQRLTIIIDLGMIAIFWPAVTNSQRDILFRNSVLNSPLALVASLVLIFVSVCAFSFPGERHAEWTRFIHFKELKNECRLSPIALVIPDFDRLNLYREHFVDKSSLRKATSDRQPSFFQKRTLLLSYRDFRCADLAATDLRNADFTCSAFRGASLFGAELDGSTLQNVDFTDADLTRIRANSSDLSWANLEKANLTRAELRNAQLLGAGLKGASFLGAELNGSNLLDVHNANLDGANLEGAEVKRSADPYLGRTCYLFQD